MKALSSFFKHVSLWNNIDMAFLVNGDDQTLSTTDWKPRRLLQWLKFLNGFGPESWYGTNFSKVREWSENPGSHKTDLSSTKLEA